MPAASPQQPDRPDPPQHPTSFGAFPQQPGGPIAPYGAPPQGPVPPWSQPKIAPSYGKAWLTHGAAAFVALFLGVGIGASDQEAQTKTAASPAPTATVTKSVTKDVQVPGPKVTVTRTTTKTVTLKPKKPKGAPTIVAGDGEYLVGEDMKAGTYKTAGPEGSFGCYWERASNASGEFDAIIANGNLDGSGRITVNKGEVFKSTRCQDWKKTG